MECSRIVELTRNDFHILETKRKCAKASFDTNFPKELLMSADQSAAPVEVICAHATVAAALSLSLRIGMLEHLQRGPSLKRDLSLQFHVDPLTLESVTAALASVAIVKTTDDSIAPGPNFGAA